MKLGDLELKHRFKEVTYDSGNVAIVGPLEYFQRLEGRRHEMVLTIGGWVSHPLPLDAQIIVHEDVGHELDGPTTGQRVPAS